MGVVTSAIKDGTEDADEGIVRGLLHAIRGGAGASAREQYTMRAKRWRRQTLGRLYAMTAILVPVLVVAEVLERHFGAWAIGLVTGGLVALAVLVHEDVPQHIAKWRSGYEGEAKTGRQLASLRDTHAIVLHDLREPGKDRANLDHVLVAPWGVYLLDSKLPGGPVWAQEGVLRVQIGEDESDWYSLDRLPAAMKRKAATLSRQISATAGVTVFVQPVVVFWRSVDTTALPPDGVAYVHGPELAAWLEERSGSRRVLEDADVRRTAVALQSSLPAQSSRRAWRLILRALLDL